MCSSDRNVSCPPRRPKIRSLIAVALATVIYVLSTGGSDGWSTALAQKPDAKSASGDKSRSGENSARSRDGKGGKRAGKGNQRRGKGRRGRRGPATVFVDKVTEGIAVDTVQIYGRVIALL